MTFYRTITTEETMQTQATKRLWYEGKTGNHQGLIIEEETGRNIAVTYDKADAAFIVRAFNSYDELLADREYMKRYREAYCHQVTVIQAMREALELAVVLHPHNVTFTKALALANGSSGRGMKRNPHPRRRPWTK